MGLMTAARGHPVLVWVGAVFAAFLLMVGTYLLVHRPEGRIALDLIEAIEDRDLDEIASLTDSLNGAPGPAEAVLPDFPWTDARIVETSPNDSSYDYDVVVEVASTDLTRSGGARLNFAVGTVKGREVILDPMVRGAITAKIGGGLTAVTIDGRDVGSGAMVHVWLLPGIYTVTATGDGGVALAGRLTVTLEEEPALALTAVA
ncbi:hypothetical protein [Phytomonospora endophytica]|uniref:Uncharacterized protein n=1 Tax=Phytomonospora endophytica TaxID=714109 RepID=A0A841FY30_9ACTN|nr:hypothetical protein [Phytomonospora endophytica]MBB6037359.1 hypothetical protein [Phytomonospora endophytica]